MKGMSENRGNRNNNRMGESTADRDLMQKREDKKQQGISNAGGQRSDQTSNRNSQHKGEHSGSKM